MVVDKWDEIEIKEIKTQDNIQLTLSIAISENEKTNSEEYKSAKAVIDIALGRGGDQAIIKQMVNTTSLVVEHKKLKSVQELRQELLHKH